MLVIGAGNPKAGKSPVEKAWDEYGDSIEVVSTTASVLAKSVKAVNLTDGKVKKLMLNACNQLHEAHAAATTDMASAHRKYLDSMGQGDLFKEGDGRGAEDKPGNGPARARRSSRGKGSKSASAPAAPH